MIKYEINYKSVGERIKNSRISKSITQDKLAELIEVNPSHLSNIERGKAKMSTEVLVNISRTLNTSIDYLLFGDITLEHDQYTNIAILEIKEILKNKDKNDVNAFMTFCKDFSEFLKRISKW
ncbi:MAG: helix-turn-helix transcriptional regulator [Clostridia bacterium]|nr:helix-turn-helix transcriptional regulator [Clostridia bacterium]